MAFGRTEPSVYRDEHAANMRHITANASCCGGAETG